MEERIDIDTPESVVFGYQVAGIGSRFIAALIDTLILTLLLFTFFCGLGAVAGSATSPEVSGWLVALSILVVFGLIWGYYIFFEITWNGQSPGKRQIGLRVVRTDGTPITVVDSLIRNLVRVIDFLPLYYGVGLATMFFNAQARRLGDFAAGTLVVKEQRGVTLESVQRTLEGGGSLPGAPDALPLSPADLKLVTDFLNRRHELRNSDQLALRIASPIAAKLGLPEPASAREAHELLSRLAGQYPWQ